MELIWLKLLLVVLSTNTAVRNRRAEYIENRKVSSDYQKRTSLENQLSSLGTPGSYPG